MRPVLPQNTGTTTSGTMSSGAALFLGVLAGLLLGLGASALLPKASPGLTTTLAASACADGQTLRPYAEVTEERGENPTNAAYFCQTPDGNRLPASEGSIIVTLLPRVGLPVLILVALTVWLILRRRGGARDS